MVNKKFRKKINILRITDKYESTNVKVGDDNKQISTYS